jgi:hypothetical protein
VFLELLDKAHERKQNLSASINASNYAPKVFAADPNRQGLRKRDFVEAMERLMSTSKIEVAMYGKPSQPIYRLQRTFGRQETSATC